MSRNKLFLFFFSLSLKSVIVSIPVAECHFFVHIGKAPLGGRTAKIVIAAFVSFSHMSFLGASIVAKVPSLCKTSGRAVTKVICSYIIGRWFDPVMLRCVQFAYCCNDDVPHAMTLKK